MTQNIFNVLTQRFGADTILYYEQTSFDPYIIINPEDIQSICMYLRYNPELKLSFFLNLSGVDYPDREQITLVYHIYSMALKTTCVLKTSVSREFPELESIESVWKAAGWFEREIYDLLGVSFINHSNLKRILLPEDWKGHPLRKDYREEPVYHDMETTRNNLLETNR